MQYLLCDRTTGCEATLTTDGYGIFNVRTYLGVCCTQEGGVGGGGPGSKKSAQDSRGIEKLSLTLHHQGIEPKVFGFEFTH